MAQFFYTYEYDFLVSKNFLVCLHKHSLTHKKSVIQFFAAHIETDTTEWRINYERLQNVAYLSW
jgi:hypothetical protein